MIKIKIKWITVHDQSFNKYSYKDFQFQQSIPSMHTKVLQINLLQIAKNMSIISKSGYCSFLNKKYHFSSQKYRQQNSNIKNIEEKKISSPLFKNKIKDNSNAKEISDVHRPIQDHSQKIKFVLNPSQSLLTHIMRIKSTESFANFYLDYKEFFNPRILSIASRVLCSICQKQKFKISQQTVLSLHIFMDDVFSSQLKVRVEKIRKEQMKNFLFFTKKALMELSQVFGLKIDSNNSNKQLYNKAIRFRDELVGIYLGTQVDFDFYEVNELVEVFHQLIRFSPSYESSRMYKSILDRRQKIEQTVNTQFLFSATNFLLTVKYIQAEERWSREDQRNDLRESNNLNIKNVKDLQKTKKLREECYSIFFNKWLYYFEDMGQFVKLNDLKHIWPIIVLSYSGAKHLLSSNTGPKVFQVVTNILQVHNSKFQSLLSSNIRIFTNTFVLLIILSKRNPGSLYAINLKEECIKSFQLLQSSEKSKANVRIMSFLNNLGNQNIINQNQQKSTLQFINTL